MVALLGQRDELLHLVEAGFDSQILVRGTRSRSPVRSAEIERVALLFEELCDLGRARS